MALENEKYMSFTTFRRDGSPVATPVWLVQLPDGEIGFSTGFQSGKVKRLRREARVTLQACDRRGGDLHGPVLDGQARLASGAELAAIREAISAKYGVAANVAGAAMSAVQRVRGRRGPFERVGVVVTLSGAPA